MEPSAAIESGFIQGDSKAAYEFLRAVEKNGQVVVGVNDFKVKKSAHLDLRVEQQIERDQVRRSAHFA